MIDLDETLGPDSYCPNRLISPHLGPDCRFSVGAGIAVRPSAILLGGRRQTVNAYLHRYFANKPSGWRVRAGRFFPTMPLSFGDKFLGNHLRNLLAGGAGRMAEARRIRVDFKGAGCRCHSSRSVQRCFAVWRRPGCCLGCCRLAGVRNERRSRLESGPTGRAGAGGQLPAATSARRGVDPRTSDAVATAQTMARRIADTADVSALGDLRCRSRMNFLRGKCDAG